MAYKVINKFRDAEDNNRLYREGDEFPVGDSQPSEERIEVLSTVHPEHKRIFIELVDEEENKKMEEEEKEAIKAELEALGVSFHPNTGLEKLRDKLEEAKAAQDKKE